MLHIILLVLKIIGIILLCIIGAILLALFCVLFVPVRYRIEVMREEGEGKPPVVVKAKITWLLHLLNILIRYPAETLVRVRLMFFTILKIPYQKDQEDKEAEKNPKKKSREKSRKKKDTKADIRKEKNGKKPEGEKLQEKADKALPEENAEKIPTVTIKAVRPEEEDDGTEESPSFMDKLRALPVIIQKIIQKIKSLFENIQYTIRKFCDKIKSISDNIQYYKEVVESDTFQNSFGLCKEELAAILKSLRPQKFEARLIVGMDDPAATGKILAVCGMLYPILGGHIDVSGDFERKRIEGQAFIKGKIHAWTFLRAAVRIYFNKDIRRLLRLLKKEAA